MKSFLAYKFTCASCSSSYIGETCHFKTRIEEHIKKDNKSHIFKHLHSTKTCFDSYNYLCLKIINKANSKFYLNIREALHINFGEMKLECTAKSFLPTFHYIVIAFVPPCSLLFLVVFFWFFLFCFFYAFLFHILFSLCMTLIISIFYCLNYTLLLLHLIAACLVSHLSLSSTVFISLR